MNNKDKDREIHEFILAIIFGYPVLYLLAPFASNGNIPEDYKQKYYWLEILIVYIFGIVITGCLIFRDDKKRVTLTNSKYAFLYALNIIVNIALIITFNFVIKQLILKLILMILIIINLIIFIYYLSSKCLIFYKDKIILYNFKRKKYPKDAHIKVIINNDNVVININEDTYTFKLSNEQLHTLNKKITDAYENMNKY